MDRADFVSDFLDSQRRIEQIAVENEILREKLERRRSLLLQLRKFTLSAATVLTAVDSSVPDVEPCSLRILTDLPHLNVVVPTEVEPEVPKTKVVVAGFLSRVLRLIVEQFARQPEDLNVLLLFQLEARLGELFRRGEDDGIVPGTDPGSGWKKGLLEHQELFRELGDLLTAPEGNAEEEPPDDDDEF
jgi:hypothetical protein